MYQSRLTAFAFVAAVAAWQVPAASAQSADNVAVVVNDASRASQQIADYYVRKRGIPPRNLLHIRTTEDETVTRDVFTTTIERPLMAGLGKAKLQDRVLYIVLTKGVPLRIAGTAGTTGTAASVDSELTLLYRRMSGVNAPAAGRLANPYFLANRELSDAKRFNHRDWDIYLVSRLDAFTTQDVLSLIDRGALPTAEGKIVLDQQDRLVNRGGDDWLSGAATRLKAAGHGGRVVLEMSVQPARDIQPVLGYFSWGSADPRNRTRQFGMRLVPGSLAGTYAGSGARTFAEPPPAWVPTGNWDDRSSYFREAPQTLVADLLREGATGVAGSIAEVSLDSVVRPDVLFPAYLAGFNLIESFYLALPDLSWQTVVVGDPLAAPFRRAPLTQAELESPVSPETDLPRWFGARRLSAAVKQVPGVSEPALALGLRAEVQLERGDLAAARALLELATEKVPGYAAAHLQLASLYEGAGQIDASIARYRQVLALQPGNIVALNNLAFRLATSKRAYEEALPLARRALMQRPSDPTLTDTVAWIEHLSGDSAAAAGRIGRAVQAAPANAEIRLHAAMIYEKTGALAVARNELALALKLNPALRSSKDVQALQNRLGSQP